LFRASLAASLVTEREQAGKAEAERRLVGIKRAYGSLATEYGEDIQKLQELAVAYREQKQRIADRFNGLRMLRAEGNALADRFGLPVPDLSNVVPPIRHDGIGAAWRETERVRWPEYAYTPPHLERNEFGVKRRTYREVRGTPTYDIIVQAGGPKPFPAVSAARQAAAEERREIEARSLRQFEAEVPKVVAR